MVTVSVAGLVCWITGAFFLGIVYGRRQLARALANDSWRAGPSDPSDVGAPTRGPRSGEGRS
jgi:hypothetical protein